MMEALPIKGYLYVINYAEGEEVVMPIRNENVILCGLVINIYFHLIDIDPSRSVFIKERLTILYRHETYEGLYEQVKANPVGYETFKCLFLRFKNQTVEYKERLERLKQIGFLIGGR